MEADIKIFDTPQKLAESMAEEFKRICEMVISRKGKINIAVSGGNTPKILFQELGNSYKNNIDWSKVFIFWVDERCVPPDNEESNYLMTRINLLDKINIPEENIYRIEGENVPYEEAERYSGVIREHVRLSDNVPEFDLIFLGVGDDGHTASIFPDQMYLLNSDNYFEVARNPSSGQKRITMTGKIINKADRIYFLVTGKNKKAVICEILEKKNNYLSYPAANIKIDTGHLKWYLDTEAFAT